jgi:hypothetical protein
MKYIHLLPTNPNDETGGGIWVKKTRDWCNIYITSNENLKEGDWYFITESISKCESKYEANDLTDICKKIILTTDTDLIADGVQAIDDKFLEWFVKNPGCEEIQVDKFISGRYFVTNPIIPQEEPNETFKSE